MSLATLPESADTLMTFSVTLFYLNVDITLSLFCNYSQASYNNISINDNLPAQRSSHKIIVKLKNPYHLETAQPLCCRSAKHCLHPCGGAGRNKPMASPIEVQHAHYIIIPDNKPQCYCYCYFRMCSFCLLK